MHHAVVTRDLPNIKRFNPKMLNEVEGKDQYRVEVSELNAEVDINRAWQTIRENIKISA
jgi:hypothetical protein